MILALKAGNDLKSKSFFVLFVLFVCFFFFPPVDLDELGFKTKVVGRGRTDNF